MAATQLKKGVLAVAGEFKDAGMIPHFHEAYSIGIFYAGEYRYRSGTRTAILRPGELRIVSPYELHETFSGTWNYLHFDIDAPLIKTLAEEIAQKELSFAPKLRPLHKDPALTAAGKRLYASLKGEALELEEAFDAFGSLLLQRSFDAQACRNLLYDRTQLGRALDYLFAHWDQSDLSVDEIAEAAGLSTYYFVRSFGKAFGTTPHRFLLSLRAERAKKMIAEEKIPPARIAFACGFSDQSHMIRIFRKFFGYTPGSLRV
ncbi:helix-turn-helix transcriptional regulator [Nitratifractor salsuginis]|uniref:Transcriptional regulator, AraC family n=1 Tax=Nitratifractor salsuginis (strain DSM 16511 / JCM 12458 / E9I37-1) TaxID=749222 RepID=E6X137_NITSE|nr:AraC family transcriptional regulator [Nitratifractor salsuginis]ADV45840.1 transcriptional regulator, AraC family [Nitratifractor salsuginis DSM 16511]